MTTNMNLVVLNRCLTPLLIAAMLWLAPPVSAQELNLVITLPRADLQRRVERLFPRVGDKPPLKLRLSHPQVILREHSERIGLKLDIDASFTDQFAVSGSASVDGVLRFVKGKFYLDQPDLKELQIDGVPEAYLGQLRLVGDGMLKEVLRDQPIYTLGQLGESKRIMGSEIKAVHVHDGKLLVELAMP